MAEKYDSDSHHNEDLKEKENVLHAEVLDDPDLLAGAFVAENREHNQGLWVSCREDTFVRRMLLLTCGYVVGCDEKASHSMFLGIHDVLHHCNGIILHVPQRQLRRTPLVQRAIRRRNRSRRNGSNAIRHPHEMAILPVPSRPMRCIRRSSSRRTSHQQTRIPMDDTHGTFPDERHHLHHFLRRLA